MTPNFKIKAGRDTYEDKHLSYTERLVNSECMTGLHHSSQVIVIFVSTDEETNTFSL